MSVYECNEGLLKTTVGLISDKNEIDILSK